MTNNYDKLKLLSAGHVIKKLREEQNLTLMALADKLGWNKGRLSRYENNQVGLSTDAINEISKALNIPSPIVLILCLKQIYPALSDTNSKTAKLLDQLSEAIKAEEV
jgi:transcriptional regulator with XRE-family HTH domain